LYRTGARTRATERDRKHVGAVRTDLIIAAAQEYEFAGRRCVHEKRQKPFTKTRAEEPQEIRILACPSLLQPGIELIRGPRSELRQFFPEASACGSVGGDCRIEALARPR
jgi:hypothetical protein